MLSRDPIYISVVLIYIGATLLLLLGPLGLACRAVRYEGGTLLCYWSLVCTFGAEYVE